MVDRKTAKLIGFEESDCLHFKTLCNSLSFKKKLKNKMFKTLNRILVK